MRRSVLIVMIDVMVLSVLSLTRGGVGASNILPVHRWSTIIEQGLAKEQQLNDEIARLKEAAARERKAAELAERLANMARQETDESRKREEEARLRAMTAENLARTSAEREAQARVEAALAEQAAREASARAKEASERESDAVARADKARKEAELADSRARAAREKEMKALAKVTDAEKLKARAEVAARQALDQAALARREAVAAEQAKKDAEARVDSISESTAEAEKERALALQRAQDAEKAMQGALERAKFAEQTAARDSDRLTRLEKQYSDALAEASSARERAAKAEVAAQEKTQLVAAAEEDRQKLKKELEKVAEDAVEFQVELAEKEREAETASAALARIEKEKKQSIWVLMPKVLRQFDIEMAARDKVTFGSNWKNEVSLQLPLVHIDNVAFAVADFESAGFDWGMIRKDSISNLELLFRGLDGKGTPMRMRTDLVVNNAEPRVVYLPVQNSSGTDALRPVGIGRLRAEQLTDGILFKKNSVEKSMRVEIVPSSGDYAVIRKKLDAKSNLRIEQGDYITTPNGLYVGIMVSKSRCFVVPNSLSGRGSYTKLPIKLAQGEKYYNRFSYPADRLKELIKKLPKD